MQTANNYKGIEFLYSGNGAKFVEIEKAIDLHLTVLVINDFKFNVEQEMFNLTGYYI